MKKQEKKYWEKPTVKSLSVKAATKSGTAPHYGESTEAAYKKGWQPIS